MVETVFIDACCWLIDASSGFEVSIRGFAVWRRRIPLARDRRAARPNHHRKVRALEQCREIGAFATAPKLL